MRRRELRITHVTPNGAADVVIEGAYTTVGQLALALRGVVSDLVIDGHSHSAESPLDFLGDGSVVGGAGRRSGGCQWALRCVAGPATGTLVSLTNGRNQIGRDLLADATVSSRHFAVVGEGDLFVASDTGSTNGTFIDNHAVGADPHALEPGALITAGATQCVLESRAAAFISNRTLRHHRPPRRPLPPPSKPVELPPSPNTTSVPTRFSWAAVIAPLLLGLGFAVLFDWRMAAFALLSPLLGIGTWLEDRRRARHDRRAAIAQRNKSLAAFRSSVAAAAEAERVRRHELLPSAAACIERSRSAATELWERRRNDADFGLLRLGVGAVEWRPEVSRSAAASPLEEAEVEAQRVLIEDWPVGLRIAPGETVGIWGDEHDCLALARSLLVQAAVLHGPADLAIAVSCEPSADDRWEWVKWLPHHRVSHEVTDSRLLLHVLDGMSVEVPGNCAAIALAPSRDLLPASCTQIVTITEPAVARIEQGGSEPVRGVVMDGVPVAVAEEVARALAPVVDPECPRHAHAMKPTLFDVAGVRPRWGEEANGLAAAMGTSGDSPFSLDLVADGPHALIAGTTGSGKSELLRTLVASLAFGYSPAQVTFFLVDYKGGSAFDACTKLPHVVGMLTDLDDDLAERALVSLEAELRHRERRLRAAHASDLRTFVPPSGEDPLPRLVIVIDEFAALQRDVPDFVDALVQIAQRGRSLGIHLVLATQRPQGVISDAIRANTNLRICLRVQDAAESQDVIGAPDAALLPRNNPGAAIARIGHAELVSFQVAHASSPRRSEPAVRPFTRRTLDVGRYDTAHGQPSQLEELVAAVQAAHEGATKPRRPWLPPLRTDVDLSELPRGAAGTRDDPAHQRQEPWEWVAGPLQMYGVAGAGTTTALVTVALSAARASSPEELHIYALDFGAGGLQDLASLPHTGAVVSGADVERVVRCVDWLHDVVQQRRAARAKAYPRIVVLLDGWSAFSASFDTIDGLAVRERMARVITDGGAVGVDVAFTGDSPIAIPASLAMAVPAKLVFRLSDRYDYAAVGVQPRAPFTVAGRCVDAVSGLTMQMAFPTPAAFCDAGRWPGPERAPQPVQVLPTEVKLADLGAAVERGTGILRLPIGVEADGESIAVIELAPGDHILVIGGRATGRSTALLTLAASVATAAGDASILAICAPSSPLAGCTSLDRWIDIADDEGISEAVSDIEQMSTRWVVLVDDADRCAAHEALNTLTSSHGPNVHVFAAGRADSLRHDYSHWARRMRVAANVCLQPGEGTDAEVIAGLSLPRRPFVASTPGRGELITRGEARLVQVALP